jgi:hypothetical protein
MKQFTFLLFMIFMTGTICFPHNLITGKVVDKQTKNPLTGANIMVTGTYLGTITDQFGTFTLKTDSVIKSITVSFIGYAGKIIPVTRPGENFLIELEATPMELNQIIVSSTTVNNLKSLSKVDADLRAANTSQDVLRMIPGLFIAQHAGGGKAEQIFLRGIDNDHGTDIDISVDGIPVNMVSHAHGQGYADLHFLIPELVSSIDFGKGPYYTDHGNFNTSGYVGFHTPDRLDNSMVKLEGGMFNTLRGVALLNLLGNGTQKKQSAYLASEMMLTNGPFESPQNFLRLNLFAKYSNYINLHKKLIFELSTLSSKWDASGQIPERAVKEGIISRFGSIDDTDGGYTGRTNAMIKLINNKSGRAFSENMIYFTDYYFELYSNFTFFLKNPVDGDQIRQKEKRKIYGYKTRYKFESLLGEFASTTEVGGGFRYDDINNIELSNTKSREITLNQMALGNIDEVNAFVYANESLEKGKWVLNLGLRGDYFKFDYDNKQDTIYKTDSKNKFRLSPKLNLLLNLNANVQLYFKTGLGFHSNDTRVVLSHESGEILPVALGADLGTIFKIGKRFIGQTALWYLHMQSELVYVGDDAIVEPGGRTQRFGLDVSTRFQFTNWLFADLDLNLAHPRYLDEPSGENYVPLAPTFTSIGGITLKHSSGFNGSLRYRYMKNRPANEQNTVTAWGYTVADMVINYTKQKYEVGFTIENLFNTEWNEAQFDTESRLYNEPQPVSELHFTPGTPFFIKARVSFFF